MNKLIELLNQFEKEKKSWYTWRSIDSYDNCVYWVDCDWETEITMYSDLYSKYYGFIQWLVDNDKIAYRRCLDLWYEIAVIDEEGEDVDVMRTFDSYEQLLMYLAIQDSPIDFLVSILKD